MLYFAIGVVVGAILVIGISCCMMSSRISEAERRAEHDAPAESVEDFYGRVI